MRSDPDSFTSGLVAGMAVVGFAWLIVAGPWWGVLICAFVVGWTAWAESR